MFWLKPLFHQINMDSYGIIMEALIATSVNSKRVELEIWGWSWINDNLIRINFKLFLWVWYWYLICFNKFILNQNIKKNSCWLSAIKNRHVLCFEWKIATYPSRAYNYLQFKTNPSSVAQFIGKWHHYKCKDDSVFKIAKMDFSFFQKWTISDKIVWKPQFLV